jgi:hypothetical protein
MHHAACDSFDLAPTDTHIVKLDRGDIGPKVLESKYRCCNVCSQCCPSSIFDESSSTHNLVEYLLRRAGPEAIRVSYPIIAKRLAKRRSANVNSRLTKPFNNLPVS